MQKKVDGVANIQVIPNEEMDRCFDHEAGPWPIIFSTKQYVDARGAYFDVYNQANLSDMGIGALFSEFSVVQLFVRVFRGLHFQNPYGQAKLVIPIIGTITDFILDVRSDSKTLGQGVLVDLSPVKGIFIPKGFAHGYWSGYNQAYVIYGKTDHYSPEDEKGIYVFDPNLKWGKGNELVKSLNKNDREDIIRRDKSWPTLEEAKNRHGYLPK